MTGPRRAGRRLRRIMAGALALVAAMALTACTRASAAPAVVIGAGSTDEQRVLAALTREALRRAGVLAEITADLGGTLGLRRQALSDQIDLYWDYTGAAWALGLREAAPPADPLDSWERVRQADREQGLRWLQATHANATFALMVRREDLPAARTERDLGWLAGELSGGERRLCADREFIARPDGLASLAAEYGIDTAALPTRAATEEQAIAAVRAGDCFAGLATATSGPARAAGLRPVDDELRVFPAFVVAPVVRAGSAADSVTVAAALREISRGLDTATLAELNARVAAGEAADVVAAVYLDARAATDATPVP